MKIKTILLGLLIAGGTAAAFAFSKAPKDNDSVITRTFYHDGSMYVLTQPNGTQCEVDIDGYCTITYVGEENLLPSAPFAEGSIPPAATGVTRSLNDPNKSWQ